jgi:pimeloyl-ACP methyl ester carboxylesterase
MHLFYLHGFASSAASSKAAFLADRLARHSLPLHVPDFNEPAFETITITRMIDQVRAAVDALPAGKVVLVGSSLGAYVAWHVAAEFDATERPLHRLVLLAPAFDFGKRRMAGLTAEDVERWRSEGTREFFHYGYNEPRHVGYALFEDAQRHDSDAVTVRVPGLVFMGRHDEIVPASDVEAFCARRGHLELVMLDDGHQLAESLETIWAKTERFLGLSGE